MYETSHLTTTIVWSMYLCSSGADGDGVVHVEGVWRGVCVLVVGDCAHALLLADARGVILSRCQGRYGYFVAFLFSIGSRYCTLGTAIFGSAPPVV